MRSYEQSTLLPEEYRGSRWSTISLVAGGSVIVAFLSYVLLVFVRGLWRRWEFDTGRKFAMVEKCRQSFARWEVLVVGKNDLHSPSIKRRSRKAYMRKINLYTFMLCFLQISRATEMN